MFIFFKKAFLLKKIFIFLVVVCFLFKLFSFLPISRVKAQDDSLNNSFPNIPELLTYLNDDRATYGLNPVKEDAQLTKAAFEKARDMINLNYWAHDNPNGVTPWQFMSAAVYEFGCAGENLAKGISDSVELETTWIISPSHKAEILTPCFKDVGFGYARGKIGGTDTIIVVEFFGTKKSEFNNERTSPYPELPSKVPTPYMSKPVGKSYVNKRNVSIVSSIEGGDNIIIYNNNKVVEKVPIKSDNIVADSLLPD